MEVGRGRRVVTLSHPDRVLLPDDGVTKGDLVEYYRAVAPALVPHLRNRPFTMKRSPYGVAGDTYFQKQAPKGMPSWIPTRTYRTYPRTGESRLVDFPLVNSREALLWMVQMHCIDMNAWYSRVPKLDRPDFVLFDLDPALRAQKQAEWNKPAWWPPVLIVLALLAIAWAGRRTFQRRERLNARGEVLA